MVYNYSEFISRFFIPIYFISVSLIWFMDSKKLSIYEFVTKSRINFLFVSIENHFKSFAAKWVDLLKDKNINIFFSSKQIYRMILENWIYFFLFAQKFPKHYLSLLTDLFSWKRIFPNEWWVLKIHLLLSFGF